MTSRRIAVILGGRSSENPISVASATSVIDALERSGNEVVTVQIDREGRWQLGAGTKALESGAGRIETVVLPHQYRHLSPLVNSTVRKARGAEKVDEGTAVPRPLVDVPLIPAWWDRERCANRSTSTLEAIAP